MSLNRAAALTRPARAVLAGLHLSEIAELVSGELLGSADPWIDGVAGIREAGESELTYLAKTRYRPELKTSKAAGILVYPGEVVNRPAIAVEDPAMAFMIVVRRFGEALAPPYLPGIHESACVHPTVRLGHDVHVGPNVVLESGVEIGDRTVVLASTVIEENVQLGGDCIIYPNVTIRSRCEVGSRVILHSGVVLGSDGFGFVKNAGLLHKVPHIGTVVIEDDVEIGANSCVDRATTGVTLVGRFTKIDNLVQIAHNVQIGHHSIMCAQSGVAGSTRVGAGVVFGGQAGARDHLEIGDGANIAAKSAVLQDVPPRSTVSGYPARDHSKAKRQYASVLRLPEALEVIRELQRRVEALEASRESNP